MLTNREIDIVKASLRTLAPTTSEEMQEVNIILGKLESMRPAQEVPSNGGNASPDAGDAQTV
jgi:hypothetical protein